MFQLMVDLAIRMCVYATLAYLFTRTGLFKRLLRRGMNPRDRLGLMLVFAGLGIYGSYTGIHIQGAIANSRVIGAVVAGLLGGPAVGFGAGLIAGIHRYYLGGFTALACGLSTTVEGLLAGLVARRVGTRAATRWTIGFATTFVAEILQMVIILALARPFEAAVDLVSVIGWPMIIVNSVGVAIFISMISLTIHEDDKVEARQTQKVLEIANRTLPYFRQGLTPNSAQNVAAIILEHSDYSAVTITDRQMILAHAGSGADHHGRGQPVVGSSATQVIETGRPSVAIRGEGWGCQHSDCPLGSAFIVPLKSRGKVIGSLRVYRGHNESLSTVDMELVKGMASLFATQLELAEWQRQAKLAAEAELKALQAQINPHFLFNALNTIVYLVRSDPAAAKELLLDLSGILRRNLRPGREFVALSEEIDYISSYLRIEKARYGDRLRILYDINPELMELRVPALIIQPLVENAVKHGIGPLNRGGTITIRARESVRGVEISVEDDGVGMPLPAGQGIGLTNVNGRLMSLYGEEYALAIDSRQGEGTRVTVVIPKRKRSVRQTAGVGL